MSTAVLSPAADPQLEMVELELALQSIDGAEAPAIRIPRAIEMAGGQILFQFDGPEDASFSWMAAVCIGEGSDRQFAIVSAPSDGGAVRVEAADECELPVARIAAAYAGVLEHLRPAA